MTNDDQTNDSMRETYLAYKLFRVRADGSLGSLFIAKRDRLPLLTWLPAETHPTKGYAVRPGWHACAEPRAPHLSTRGRAWYVVMLRDVETHQRPEAQGGLWYTAGQMRILGEATPTELARYAPRSS